MSKKEIAVQEETTKALALVELGNGLEELEGFDVTDVKIPFLIMLQAMSPQCKPRDPLYVQGAAEGLIMHTLTQDIYDILTVVPVKLQKRYSLWSTTPDGRLDQMVRDVPLTEAPKIKSMATKNDKGKLFTAEGFRLVEKWTFWVVAITEQGLFRAGINMKDSQIKNAKLWLSLLQSDQGFPNYQYVLGSKTESYDTNSWAGWSIHHEKIEGKKISALTNEILVAELTRFRKDLNFLADAYSQAADSVIDSPVDSKLPF